MTLWATQTDACNAVREAGSLIMGLISDHHESDQADQADQARWMVAALGYIRPGIGSQPVMV